jgi:hypothetical protein
MKHIYYYIWIGLAFLHKRVSRIVVLINKLAIRFGQKSEKEQKDWRKNFNDAFLRFPGGMLDWGAFGLLLVLIFIPIIFLSVYFRIPIFSSGLYFGGLFIGVTGLVYFLIYFKSLPWLKEKIRMVNKKYYF